MSLITTTCPTCGEIELPLSKVVLRVCEDDQTGACVIRCHLCGARFSKVANDPMMAAMVAVGIEVETWSMPLEVVERPHGFEPVSVHDVHVFGAMLADEPDIVGRMLAS